MQRKLRQGFGRDLRSETDVCVVSILDHRAAPEGKYYQAVLDALPYLSVTRQEEEVKAFFRRKTML